MAFHWNSYFIFPNDVKWQILPKAFRIILPKIRIVSWISSLCQNMSWDVSIDLLEGKWKDLIWLQNVFVDSKSNKPVILSMHIFRHKEWSTPLSMTKNNVFSMVKKNTRGPRIPYTLIAKNEFAFFLPAIVKINKRDLFLRLNLNPSIFIIHTIRVRLGYHLW